MYAMLRYACTRGVLGYELHVPPEVWPTLDQCLSPALNQHITDLKSGPRTSHLHVSPWDKQGVFPPVRMIACTHML